MRCEEVRDGLGLLVLGALSPAESAQLESHLADCAECAAERRHLGEAVDMLPWAASEVDPPTGIEQRLRAHTMPAGEGGRNRRSPIWNGWRPWVPAAAAAMLILNLGLAGTTGLLYFREQSTLAQLNAGNAQAAQDRSAVAALASGSGRALALRSTGTAGRAYGVFRADPALGQVVLVVYGLSPSPSGRVYQGWMHRGAERISIGVFTPQGLGGAVVLALSGQSTTLLSQIDGFGITLEPVGGSAAPTSPPVMIS